MKVKFVTSLFAVVVWLCAVAPGLTAAQLSMEDMAQLRGGCDGPCVGRSSHCWEGCIPGECDLKFFCSNTYDYHYTCKTGAGGTSCEASTVTAGCGELREDGYCSGFIGECMGGIKTGECDRTTAQGSACP